MIHHRTLIKSFGYAFEGIYYALKYNQNLRIHFLIAILVIIASVIFKVSAFEMGILGVMILLVICTEMINTTIEQMVDLIVNEHRQEAKVAKDVSAGMVLLAAIGSVIVGLLIFVPHVLKLFGR
ncbi:MAG: diacylglycerol kinase family protein [Candidatus Levybacteria bacterium]|nr:diacylglycerol kinase family protein [Candidatus Levybacteria bacterium]